MSDGYCRNCLYITHDYYAKTSTLRITEPSIVITTIKCAINA